MSKTQAEPYWHSRLPLRPLCPATLAGGRDRLYLSPTKRTLLAALRCRDPAVEVCYACSS